MDTKVIVFLIALFAVAIADHSDNDLTQILQGHQEEEEDVQSVQQGDTSDLTQIFQGLQEDDEDDVQSNSVQQGDTDDLTQIFQSQKEVEQEVQPNSAEQEAASDITQIFESEQEEVQQNSVEQESEAEIADGDCGVTRVQRCLTPIATFVATEEDDSNVACEAVRSTYYCLKDMADSCLHGEERESVEPRLNQIKSAMDANCVFNNDQSDEQKCIDSTRIYLKDCLYKGIIQTYANFKKSGENDTERFKCMAYGAIADCQTEIILDKCGDVAAEEFHDYMADMPEEIQVACDATNEQPDDIYQLQLQVQHLKK